MKSKFQGIDALVVVAGAACVALAYTARYTLNADGVSYLDIAAALAHGDLSHFVQGYWSPLYPLLLAPISLITGNVPSRLIVAAHVINLLCVIGALAIVRQWSRRFGDAIVGWVMIAAVLLAAAGAPRVEVVTPDLLLLLIICALSYEIVAHRGRRWLPTGLCLGLAFLAKTSAWPWLVLAAIVRLLAARDSAERRSVVRSTVTCAAVMLVWVLPISVRYGQLTLGSAARLNACWYLEDCQSRTPDTDDGNHASYRSIATGAAQPVMVATFSDAERWTYEPWSDPTAWDRGVESRQDGRHGGSWLFRYWLGLLGRAGIWLLPLLLAVIAPALRIGSPRGAWRRLLGDERSAGVAMVLGIAGVAQFIAVHAEPRLIAPFALMFALGWIAWLAGGSQSDAAGLRADDTGGRSRMVRQAAASIGCVVALTFLVDRIGKGISADRRIAEGAGALDRMVATFSAQGFSTQRIAVVGPAMPITATAYWVGSHIVAQVLPRSAPAITALPAPARQAALTQLFGDRADMAWLTNAAGAIEMVPLRAQR